MRSGESGWQEMTCLKGNISFMLPQDWKRAGNEIIARKFPYGIKPQETFTDLEENKFLTWNLLDKQLQEMQVYQAIYEIQRRISHIYPESIQQSASRFQVAAGIVGYFIFVTGGIKCDTMHCMFILPVKKRMMFGSYHFAVEGMSEEIKFLKKIFRSMKILDDENSKSIIKIR